MIESRNGFVVEGKYDYLPHLTLWRSAEAGVSLLRLLSSPFFLTSLSPRSCYTLLFSLHTHSLPAESAVRISGSSSSLEVLYIYIQGLSRRHMYILSASLIWRSVLSTDPCIIGVHMIMLEYPKTQIGCTLVYSSCPYLDLFCTS